MACQCYLNFVATPSNETCPRTGLCTNALDVVQVTRSRVLILILANSLRFEKENFALKLFSYFREANYDPVMSKETLKSVPLVLLNLEMSSLTTLKLEMDLGHTPTMVFFWKLHIPQWYGNILGNTNSPMVFETMGQSANCRLEMTFDCWQNWPSARGNRQVLVFETFFIPPQIFSRRQLLQQLS